MLALGLVFVGCRPPTAEPAKGRFAVASMVILGDEILAALGPSVRERTVAVSALADDPRYSGSPGAWPQEVPRLTKNPEAAISLDLDVLLVASFTDAEYRAAVEPVIPRVVELRDFDGFEGYLANLVRVGEAVGEVERARALGRAFEARIDAVRARQPYPPDLRPSCLSWGHGATPGAETTFHAAAEAAGCVNVPAAAGLSGHRRVDAEQVLAWDPDFVILSCRDDGENDCALARAEFEQLAGFGGLRAVRRDQIIMIPPPLLSTTGVGMAELAERIQAGLRRDSVDRRGTPATVQKPVELNEELECSR